MATAAANNPVVLKRGVGIGTGNAESDDEFLFDCFITYPPVDAALRLTSPAMIISGRTGAGKTAILRHIESEVDNCVAVDPFEMSMGYVSNSDTLRFLSVIGADLDLLFQALWKHVLCIEFIRLRWRVDDTQKSKNIFSRLLDKFEKEERKTRPLNYLKEWEGKFWITMDQNIKEITESFERKIHAEMGAEVNKFKAGGQYDKRLSTEKKSELIARTRKIISSEQLAELHGVIDMLSVTETGEQMKAFYILIDRLDERWVDDGVRFRMIKALMESLKSFRKIHNLKVLVALRSDVLERVVQETADISFQREKFEDYMTHLIWSEDDLRRLVDARIGHLFKRRYTNQDVDFSDVFPSTVGKRDTFQWMLERTLMRPRDIIAFVNEAFNAADGKTQVSLTALRQAEVEYARRRRDALIQEWGSSFPSLGKVLDFFAQKKRVSLELDSLDDEGLDDLALAICSETRQGHDPAHMHCQTYVEGKSRDRLELLQELVAILYRTGAIGLKLNSDEQVAYSHINQPLISPRLITRQTRARLHPMLHAAYHLHER